MEDEGDDTCTQASAISIFENHYHLTYMPFTTSEWNRLGGQKLPRKLSKKNRRRNDPWRLSTKHIPPRIEAPWKLDLLGGWPPRIIQTAKRINLMTKFTLRQENIATAKDIIFHDGYRPPTKLLRHSLVVLSHQVNFFSW